ncbi:MAG: hypothetical protein JWO67_7192 [Streptosporangiaceae bacterium]|nr:hypothetical protein [Streptosporangiaceae bacterium]
MPRIVLPVTVPSRDGVPSPTEQAGDVTNGHVVTNTSRTIITVRNADTAPHNVTFVTPGTVDSQPVGDRTVAVGATSTVDFGRFNTDTYGSQMAITVDSAMLKLTAREP